MIIHAKIDEPYKGGSKTKSTCFTVECSNSDNCGLYARGECAWLGVFGWQRCPYGKPWEEDGYTKRAGAYGKWIRERKEKYKDQLNKLDLYRRMLAKVGDYIFLPYAHMTTNEKIPFLAAGGFFAKENCFLPEVDFTIENIISICEFKPYAMMGGEITSYQAEVVPEFIKHLSEQMPDIFAKLCEQYERAKSIEASYSNVGRKALLRTINLDVKLVDCHGAEWIWDGEYLTSYNSKASFVLVKRFSEMRIKPKENSVITITDDEQVNENTEFLS